MKKAGEKGWSDFQALWSGPQEEGVEDTENHLPAEGTGDREEEVGDLLGSFSDEPTAAHSNSGGPTSNKRSYGSTSYGSTGNTGTQASHQSKSQPPVTGSARHCSLSSSPLRPQFSKLGRPILGTQWRVGV